MDISACGLKVLKMLNTVSQLKSRDLPSYLDFLAVIFLLEQKQDLEKPWHFLFQ